MKNVFTKKWLEAALVRAIRTTAQTLASQIPVGLVITPVMVQNANWSILTIIIASLLTGLLAGCVAMLTALAGLPEVEE
ncbi:MAG: hypothetical protein K6D96_09220 [Acetatifactor sp.]|nr:hypothetical protein [Acetatifactor sp.]